MRVTQGTRAAETSFRSDGRVDEVSAGSWSSSVFSALATTSFGYHSTTLRPISQTLPDSRTVGFHLDAAG